MKTETQAENQSHLNNTYAPAHADISSATSADASSPATASEDEETYHRIGEPIDVALIGWAQMPVPTALDQMACVLNKHRAGLIRDVYKKLTGTKERLFIAWGLFFASVMAQHNVMRPNWRETSNEETPLSQDCLGLPGFEFVPLDFDTAQYAMVFALVSQLDLSIAFARTLPLDEATEFAQTLHIAEKIKSMYGSLGPKAFALPTQPGEAFALEMLAAWLDEWCKERLAEKPSNRHAARRDSSGIITVAEAKRLAAAQSRRRLAKPLQRATRAR